MIARVFDPDRVTVARRPFTVVGIHYRPGDVFEWRKYVDARRARQMFDSGYLTHSVNAETRSPSPPAVENAPLPKIEEAPEALHEQEDVSTDAAGLENTSDEADSDFDLDVFLARMETMSPAELKVLAERLGAPVKFRADAQRAAIRAFLGLSD